MSAPTNQVSRFANHLNQFQCGTSMAIVYTGLLGMARAFKYANSGERTDIAKLVDYPTFLAISTFSSQLGYTFTDDLGASTDLGANSAFTDAFEQALIAVDGFPAPTIADKVQAVTSIPVMIANLCDLITFTR